MTTQSLGGCALYIPVVVDVELILEQRLTVPSGAVAFQVGINSYQNTFDSNSGSITLISTVTTACSSYSDIHVRKHDSVLLGRLTNQPVQLRGISGRILDDPGGSGPTRSSSGRDRKYDRKLLYFHVTFAGGIPGLPRIGWDGVPMLWTTLIQIA